MQREKKKVVCNRRIEIFFFFWGGGYKYTLMVLKNIQEGGLKNHLISNMI